MTNSAAVSVSITHDKQRMWRKQESTPSNSNAVAILDLKLESFRVLHPLGGPAGGTWRNWGPPALVQALFFRTVWTHL